MHVEKNLVRNFVGYGPNPPVIKWPNNARIAVSIVLNYEEGAEQNIMDGDAKAEPLGEFPYPMPTGVRDLINESTYEYGSRVGVWRLLDIFDKHNAKVTFYACGQALERNPLVGKAIAERGHEPCSHGYRWAEYFRMDREQEWAEFKPGIESIERTVGERPLGWYVRYSPGIYTRELTVQEGGFLYDSNSCNDDLPYWVDVNGKTLLVIPHSLDANDMRYWLPPGFGTPRDFEEYMRETFDRLYEEGATHPKMMTIGLHARISGRPARANAVDRFMAYANSFEGVWWSRRVDIARWWYEHYPPDTVSPNGDSEQAPAATASGSGGG